MTRKARTVLAALKQEALSIPSITSIFYPSRQRTVYRWMKWLRDNGLVRIVAYERTTAGPSRPLFGLRTDATPEATKPRPYSARERMQRTRNKQRQGSKN